MRGEEATGGGPEDRVRAQGHRRRLRSLEEHRQVINQNQIESNQTMTSAVVYAECYYDFELNLKSKNFSGVHAGRSCRAWILSFPWMSLNVRIYAFCNDLITQSIASKFSIDREALPTKLVVHYISPQLIQLST